MTSEIPSNVRFNRRPSFWKTPITHDGCTTIGQKRKYDQITADNLDNDETDEQEHDNNTPSSPSPSRKRAKHRLLSHDEIESLAKCGGFHPSHIIFAVEESDGFVWFKRVQKNAATNTHSNDAIISDPRKPNNNNNNNDDDDSVLRELSKEELQTRKTAATAAAAAHAQQQQPQALVAVNVNPNEANRASAQNELQKAIRLRRHTVPVEVLQRLREENDRKEQQEKQQPTEKPAKSRKRRVKKKTVVRYTEKKEVIRKKVKKKKRIVYKKRTRSTTVKIITEFASIAIPDFPVPSLKLGAIYYSALEKPFIAIRNFELSLIESFVVPLKSVYGHSPPLAFIVRNVLQFLMEMKQQISRVVNAVPFAVLSVACQSAAMAYQQRQQEQEQTAHTNHNNEQQQQEVMSIVSSSSSLVPVSSCSQSPRSSEVPRRVKTPHIEDDSDLFAEQHYYEQQLAVLDEFCARVDGELQFTANVQTKLSQDEYLAQIFDFDLDVTEHENKDGDGDGPQVLHHNAVIEGIASEIDGIYSAYHLDLNEIESEQALFEHALNQRQRTQQALKQYYMQSAYIAAAAATSSGAGAAHAEDASAAYDGNEAHGGDDNNAFKLDHLLFSNFITANKYNDHLEDETVSVVPYLRQLGDYQMRENDTLLEIRAMPDMPIQHEYQH